MGSGLKVFGTGDAGRGPHRRQVARQQLPGSSGGAPALPAKHWRFVIPRA